MTHWQKRLTKHANKAFALFGRYIFIFSQGNDVARGHQAKAQRPTDRGRKSEVTRRGQAHHVGVHMWRDLIGALKKQLYNVIV
jgi:hypothetical protein